MKIKRHPFALLEVMIAFSLTVLCVLPLIYPHVEMYRAKKRFLERVEQDHAVNLLYVELLEKLYQHEIPWETIQSKKISPVEKLGYKGTYQFEEIKHKPPEASGFTVVLVGLKIIMEGCAHDYKVFVAKQKYREAL